MGKCVQSSLSCLFLFTFILQNPLNFLKVFVAKNGRHVKSRENSIMNPLVPINSFSHAHFPTLFRKLYLRYHTFLPWIFQNILIHSYLIFYFFWAIWCIHFWRDFLFFSLTLKYATYKNINKPQHKKLLEGK